MSGPSFRIAGIPVRIDPTFLLIVVLFGFTPGRSAGLIVAWVVIVTVSILLHELGHAFAFRRYGQRPEIVLQGMGGLTMGSGEYLPPRHHLVVSLAGPLSGLILLGLPALWLSRTATDLSRTTDIVLSDIVWVNLFWSIVNLVPVLPLDGGKVAGALWAIKTGKQDWRPIHVLSAVVAGAATAWAFTEGNLFGALFAGFFCIYNYREISAGRDEGLLRQLDQGWREMSTGNPLGGGEAAERVLAGRPSATVMAHAKELLAWSRLVQQDGAGARAALEPFPPGLNPDPFLLAALDLEAGQSQKALDLLVQGYTDGRFGPAIVAVADAVAQFELAETLADRLVASDGPGPSAAAQLAVHLHAAKRYPEAAAVGQRALESGLRGPNGENSVEGQGRVAYNLACSHARARQLGAALDWLERAAELGFADVGLLDTDPDLEPLRTEARFQAVRARLASGT